MKDLCLYRKSLGTERQSLKRVIPVLFFFLCIGDVFGTAPEYECAFHKEGVIASGEAVKGSVFRMGTYHIEGEVEVKCYAARGIEGINFFLISQEEMRKEGPFGDNSYPLESIERSSSGEEIFTLAFNGSSFPDGTYYIIAAGVSKETGAYSLAFLPIVIENSSATEFPPLPEEPAPQEDTQKPNSESSQNPVYRSHSAQAVGDYREAWGPTPCEAFEAAKMAAPRSDAFVRAYPGQGFGRLAVITKGKARFQVPADKYVWAIEFFGAVWFRWWPRRVGYYSIWDGRQSGSPPTAPYDEEVSYRYEWEWEGERHYWEEHSFYKYNPPERMDFFVGESFPIWWFSVESRPPIIGDNLLDHGVSRWGFDWEWERGGKVWVGYREMCLQVPQIELSQDYKYVTVGVELPGNDICHYEDASPGSMAREWGASWETRDYWVPLVGTSKYIPLDPDIRMRIVYADEPLVVEDDECKLPGEECGTASTSTELGNVNLNGGNLNFSQGLSPFTLYYNSLDSRSGPFGHAWTHNYNLNLSESANKITEIDEDGSRKVFTLQDGVFKSEDKYGYHANIVKNPDGSYVLRRKHGTQYIFDSEGKLTQIIDRNGNTENLTYLDGKLTKITDAYGRETTLFYNVDNRVIALSDAANRTRSFTYDVAGNLVSITNPEGYTRSFGYDDAHRMTSRVDPLGNTTRGVYDGEGRLISVVDADGNETTISYDSENKRATVTDSLNNETLYSYDSGLNAWTEVRDSSGNIVSRALDENRNELSSTDANGNITASTYDERGNLLTSTDALGNETSYTYDPVYNQILTEVDPLGNLTTHEYDEKGNRIKTIDALNQETVYTYDGNGNLISTRDAMNNTTTNTYDEYGNLSSTTDALGKTTTYSYDIVGNMLSLTDALGNRSAYEYDKLNQLIAATDAQGNRTTYAYDGNGNRIEVTDAGGNVTRYQYDSQRRLIKEIDPLNNVTEYTYDGNDNRIEAKDPAGSITSYTYDSANRLTSIRDPQGNTMTYTYDPVGNRTSVTDPEGNQTNYGYDKLNQLVSVTDPEGNTTSHSYDGKGRRIRVTDSRGRTSYTYDALDRVTEITDSLNHATSYTYDAVGNRTSHTDAQGRTTRYEYDSVGQMLSTTDPQGNKTEFEYDSVGNRTAVIDSQGKRTVYEYDSLNRLIAIIDPQGARTTYEYDSVGNRVSLTDPEGRTTRFQYDENNRVIAILDPNGNRTRYQYDSRGNRTSQTDPLGRITRYEYNSLNQLTAIVDPSGARTEFSYDRRGNLASKTDPNGNTIRYEYNSLNQLIKRTYPDGYTDIFSYDAQGNQLTKDSPSVHKENTYDSLNRLISRSVSYKENGREFPAKTISYTYDSVGNRTEMKDPLGGVTNYIYDERNQLISLSSPDNLTTTFTYDSLGRRLSMTYPNGISTSYTYDGVGRLISLVHHGLGGELISSHSYEYDKAGNRIKEIEPHRVTSYTYDEKDQLLSASITGKDNYSFSYSYDKVGNRLSMEIAGGKGEALPFEEYSPTLDEQPHLKHPVVINYDYNDADQLLSEVATRDVPQKGKGGNKAWEVNYNYDNNGNLIKKNLLKGNKGKDLKSTSYEYDYNNMITRIIYPGGEENIFRNCTCGSKRVYKKDSTGVTTYFFDEAGGIEHVLFEYDESGNVKARYTLGPRVDEIISRRFLFEDDGNSGGEGTWKSVYYHYDALGSVVALTDEKGKVVAEYDYSPFGRIIDWQGGEAKKNIYTFTGREHDRDSGLNFNRARYYDPRTGTFNTRDPSLRQSSPPVIFSTVMPVFEHPYVYVANNPIRYTDPSGLEKEECCGQPTKVTCDAKYSYTVSDTYLLKLVFDVKVNMTGSEGTDWKDLKWWAWSCYYRDEPKVFTQPGTWETAGFVNEFDGRPDGGGDVWFAARVQYYSCEAQRWVRKKHGCPGSKHECVYYFYKEGQEKEWKCKKIE